MKKISLLSALVGILCFAGGAWSASPAPFTPPDGAFQMHYASNLNLGESFINISNAGSSLSAINPTGNICANAYVFDPSEEMVACCTCLVTPDGLNSWGVNRDFLVKTLTGAIPTSVVVKLLASAPVKGRCNAASPNAGNLTTGMVAWGTTLHLTPVAGTVATTEEEFTSPVLSSIELSNLSSQCAFIQTVGSGFGICNSCRAGGM